MRANGNTFAYHTRCSAMMVKSFVMAMTVLKVSENSFVLAEQGFPKNILFPLDLKQVSPQNSKKYFLVFVEKPMAMFTCQAINSMYCMGQCRASSTKNCFSFVTPNVLQY